MLRINHTLEKYVDKKVSTFCCHTFIRTLNCDIPQSVNADQILEMQYVNHLEGASLRIMIDVSVLSIHVQEKHFETSKSFDSKACDFEFVLVAHDLLKHIGTSSFIEKVFPLAAHSRSVFLGKEVEKDILLVLTNALAHEGLEEG